MAQAIHDLRENEAILKKPSIAETLDWIAALEALGISDLTPEAMDQTKGFVLKNNEDLEVLSQSGGHSCSGHHCDHNHSHDCGCGHHHHTATEPDEADKIQKAQEASGNTLKVPRTV